MLPYKKYNAENYIRFCPYFVNFFILRKYIFFLEASLEEAGVGRQIKKMPGKLYIIEMIFFALRCIGYIQQMIISEIYLRFEILSYNSDLIPYQQYSTECFKT